MLALAILLLQAPSATELLARVEERLAILDRFRCRVEYYLGNMPAQYEPMDRQRWYLLPSLPLDVAIARPTLHAHFLRDDREVGYDPLTASVSTDGYVSLYDRLTTSGKKLLCVDRLHVQAGIFRDNPVLQLLDFNLQDSSERQLTLADLLRRDNLIVQGETGGVTTCTCRVPMNGFDSIYEFDLNERGTPLRIRTTADFRGSQGLVPSTREQRVLALEEFEGVEIPTEAVFFVDNLNVSTDIRGVFYLTIDSIERDDTLNACDLEIDVETVGSSVREVLENGTELIRLYDADGQCESEKLIDRIEAPGDTRQVATRESQTWRQSVLGICAAFGACTALAVISFGSRKR